MQEPTDRPPEPGSQPPLISTTGRLSPVQQTRRDYEQHAGRECDRCRDIDRDRCPDGDRLYRAWTDACDNAYQQLAGETS